MIRRRATATCVLAAAVTLSGCGAAEEVAAPAGGPEARTVVRSLDAPLDRLRDAAAAARPRSRSSMVRLRATADLAGDAIRRARADLRELEDTAKADQRREIRGYDDALGELDSLAQAMSASRLSVADLEVSGERARQALDDARLDLPAVETAPLAAAVRRSRKRTPALTQAGASAPVGNAPSTPAPSAGAEPVSYFNYYGPAFQARLPSGGGWAAPAQSQPTPGELFRTSVRGPDGLFAIIDYTPFEAATFGGKYSSRTTVGQTAFGSATRYVFQGGSLPECQRAPCVDYIINDASSGQGFGVLAGGGSFETAAAIAQTIAESVTPTGGE